jgi:hypothetical protein
VKLAAESLRRDVTERQITAEMRAVLVARVRHAVVIAIQYDAAAAEFDRAHTTAWQPATCGREIPALPYRPRHGERHGWASLRTPLE